ncbi:hypothetical protein ACLKA7_004654 [Drosophila subpalustris]
MVEGQVFNVTNEIYTIKQEQAILKLKQAEIEIEQEKWRKEKEIRRNIENRDYVYKDCAEVTANSMPSGIYILKVESPGFNRQIKVFCDTKTWGGGWTIILQRMDGSVNFYRDWETYIDGFGDLDGESFLGLRNIHDLTSERSQELLVLLEDADGVESYETYEKFAISSERQIFALNTLGKANGTAGDSLSYHHTHKFSTYDWNNAGKEKNCAEKCTGGWWYSDPCHKSNLAGKYGDNTFGKGINWNTFRGFENSLKRAVMMIRPRK